MGLSKRKPIYIPFPQADAADGGHRPGNLYRIQDRQVQENLRGGLRAIATRSTSSKRRKHRGDRRRRACYRHRLQDLRRRQDAYYGYGHVPQRLHLAGGGTPGQRLRPTGGEVVLRDGRKPKSVGIIHCVGSRDENTNRWCSRVCCMYSSEAGAPDQGADRGRGLSTSTSTCGRRARVTRSSTTSCSKKACISSAAAWRRSPIGRLDPSEEGQAGHPRRGHAARRGAAHSGGHGRAVGWARAAGRRPGRPAAVQHVLRQEGWFLERHPKLAPVSTFTDGIFLAGACQGPKDIPDTVAQAGAAAARGAGADRRGLRRDGTEHGLHRRGRLLRLQDLHPAVSLRRDLIRRGEATGPASTRCCARAAGRAWPPVRPDRSIRQLHDWFCRTREICRRRSRSPQLRCLNRGSLRSSATGARTWRPDLAGTSRMTLRAQRARGPRDVLRSNRPAVRAGRLRRGADGVLIGGCHPGDCHYQEGNYKGLRRFQMLKQLVEPDGN